MTNCQLPITNWRFRRICNSQLVICHLSTMGPRGGAPGTAPFLKQSVSASQCVFRKTAVPDIFGPIAAGGVSVLTIFKSRFGSFLRPKDPDFCQLLSAHGDGKVELVQVRGVK